MDQVNTTYCLRKVSLVFIHHEIHENTSFSNAVHCPVYPLFPVLPSWCASGVGLKFFLGAESFSRSLPAQMSQAASVPLERGGSSIRSSRPRGSLCFSFAQTWTTMGDVGSCQTLTPNCHPFRPTGIASIWNED